MKKLEIYLQALQAGQHERRIILKTIEELKSCTPQELSEYRLLVAALYCQLLQYCQSMYKGNVPQDIVEELLQTFESIEQIGVEATEKERYDSNLTTVWFLHELKTHGIIGCKNPTGWYVLHGKVQEDSEGKFILVVDLVSDVVGKKFSQDTEMTQLLIDTEFLDDPEGLIEEIWGSGDEYYLLYKGCKYIICS